ncbi:MAG: corrinoid protein [candidate division KSB1 bacterium]|nr:corrinoid protein [candidate division KSB1 bacterium]MDZ7276213.1 corrinoid protein [candidate division KSB1 bacterium]MDZ7287981.1 corrinoid protein [candidate division KSB1 bacterium]MDZ7300006.1 corrinoid protein [candidate division KSB1 bacterium]MDZ7308241.1 corrinoid protein [candidate division KSB1 bacterium]
MEATSDLAKIVVLLQEGSVTPVCELTKKLLAQGVSPQIILNEGLIAGMALVGEKMRRNEMYLPEVLQSASVMKAAMAILQPHLLRSGVAPLGRVVLGTVKGDMHDIGKNLVGIMLRGAGFEVVDLGVNTPPEKFVDAIQTHSPGVVGMSAMLTTTMLQMKKTIAAVAAAQLRTKVKIVIGGAPVSQRFADEIGADGYARDAVTAVECVKALLARTGG